MLFCPPILWYSYRNMDKLEETLKLATWNIQGALSDPRRAEAVLDEISRSGAHIITLPDAWHEDSEESEETDRQLLMTAGDFRRRGFTAIKASFREDRPDDNYARYGFMTLVDQTPSTRYEEIQLATRPAHHLRVSLGSQALSIVSMYLSDLSDMKRLEQITQLESHLQRYPFDAVALMGDFNAMHSDASVARVLNSWPVRDIFQLIPARNYTLPRLTRMASGIVMRRLGDNGFSDCDPLQQPTMPSRKPLFQLDHIMTRSSQTIQIEAEPPVLIGRPDLSDHQMVTTTVKLKRL